MKKRNLGLLALITAAVPVLAHAAGFFGNPFARGANASVEQAHQAFLEDNLDRMSAALRKGLADNAGDPVVKSNLLGLLAKAYQKSGSFPADWKLPAGMTDLKFVARRKLAGDGVEHSIAVGGHIKSQGLVSQVKLVRYPDEVLLDREAGVGDWEEDAPASAGDETYFEISAEQGSKPAASGLYLLDFRMKDGEQVQGWFILGEDANSTASPQITVPEFGQKFSTGNPEFRWLDFRSPEYKPESERRTIWVGVSRSEAPNYEWKAQWSYWAADPTIQSIVAGSSEGEGVGQLSAGRHVVVIMYGELKRFGPMKLSRGSTAVRPFFVQ